MPSKIDNYRLRIWLEDYLRTARATADTIAEEAKKADPMSDRFPDIVDAMIAIQEANSNAARLLWNLREDDKVADLYEGGER